VIFGGYGPRLFNWGDLNQLAIVRDILTRKQDSRRAVVQIFDRHDILKEYEDIPCTCTLQFMRRGDKLHMFTSMRSNDVYKGMTHDFFCFTMLQEIVARSLGLDVGIYKHAVGSLHLYLKDRDFVRQFLEEGWQPTIDVAMPAMPKGDPWPAINSLLNVESAIRKTGTFDEHVLSDTDPYWADLMRLLQVFGCKKHNQKGAKDKVQQIRDSIAFKIYVPFVDKVLTEFS
jgi:thymidylate synthase